MLKKEEAIVSIKCTFLFVKNMIGFVEIDTNGKQRGLIYLKENGVQFVQSTNAG